MCTRSLLLHDIRPSRSYLPNLDRARLRWSDMIEP